jgi:hypothetical protein
MIRRVGRNHGHTDEDKGDVMFSLWKASTTMFNLSADPEYRARLCS